MKNEVQNWVRWTTLAEASMSRLRQPTSFLQLQLFYAAVQGARGLGTSECPSQELLQSKDCCIREQALSVITDNRYVCMEDRKIDR